MDNIIPEQQTGIETNTEHSVDATDREEAVSWYRIARRRLFDVNNWNEISGAGSSIFTITNEKGVETRENARTGLYFKIDVPGPGPAAGDGFDWVYIEEAGERGNDEAPEQLSFIRVRPCSNPANDKSDTAHFLKEAATSTFLVARKENRLIAGVYGRNEKPNTDADNIVDKIRNAVVGLGAVGGAAKIQWKSLVRGILDTR
jgi:hypothetical protein